MHAEGAEVPGDLSVSNIPEKSDVLGHRRGSLCGKMVNV